MPSQERFLPHVTVASVVKDGDRYLMVEEISNGKRVLNQPAGHLEPNESLVEAAVREVHEETGWITRATAYLGVTLITGDNGVTYIRHSFVSTAVQHQEHLTLDSNIVEAHWLSREDIIIFGVPLRHQVVLDVIDQYEAGSAVALDLVRQL